MKLHKAGGAISALLEKYIDTASDKVVNIEQTLIVRIGKNEQNERVLIRRHPEIWTGSGCLASTHQAPGEQRVSVLPQYTASYA